jgi:uncharacterized repeat protein (TIGR03803 family)
VSDKKRLYSFTGTNDGANPSGGLVQGADGNFYGSTRGTVFQMTPAGVLTTLVSGFGSSSLAQGSDGYFYGTPKYGGDANGDGTVFKMSTIGALITLYSFSGYSDGGIPQAGLMQGRDGGFYGTTSEGGQTEWGPSSG